MTDVEAQVTLVSGDAGLIDHVTDAAAAAGFATHVCREPAGEAISRARAVLVGVDTAPALARGGLPRPSEALVVGPDGQLPALWGVASELGATGAVSLPSGSAWLVQWLHARAAGRVQRASVVSAVFSAAGGVGASTLTAAVAVTAARSGLSPLLIDAHPGPAGVGLLLGDPAAADHWSAFASIRGYLAADALGRLPVLEGVRCLGWGGGSEVPLWRGAVGSVLDAAQRDHDLAVLDVGLHTMLHEELPRRTRSILVVPASWRGVMAAAPRLSLLREVFDPPPVVVLRDVGGKSDPRAWAREFPDCQVLLLGFDAGVIDDEEQCRPPGTRPRSVHGRLSRQILAALAERAEAA